ncbi:ADP-ribosylglycohydrolase family protein [Amycolatopsis sp. 195334CR]|uniref:ADP-ribosylglycohydrolase family protein n=1 Tax=Amycolatopsis sp. 195334CR TaxID=2814588 RepID=UPI001A90C358|nr:ADP-ribosylglycohydrolase family protein [Amycolatopsis sp. 195334CR]MBN6038954.1 ADP-ribosylglycohydrolase family protein [Amycolatopsis sp. 195334CR]
MLRGERVVGAVVGSAVGDALGAPFEFGPAGALTKAGPDREMRGGGIWEPGEATDDTQMAVHLAHSLIERGNLDLPDIFDRFQRWARSRPKDIGLQTSAVLFSGDPWDRAAALHFQAHRHAAGNGALMRATTSAVYFAGQGREATMIAARQISALTHGDAAAWEGTAIFHDLLRLAFTGAEPLASLPDILTVVEPQHRPRYATVLAPEWQPETPNGAVWPCLGSAVWAVRTTSTFEDAVRAAVDLGDDTDTVAAVTGGLAGAIYGFAAIPPAWTENLHVPLPGTDQTLHLGDLVALAERLDQGPNPAGC